MATYQNLNALDPSNVVPTKADKFPFIQGNSLKAATLSSLVDMAKSDSLKAFEAQWLDMMTEGCYIVTRGIFENTKEPAKSTFFLSKLRPSSYLSATSKPYVIGVAVIEGDKAVIIGSQTHSSAWGANILQSFTGDGTINGASMQTLLAKFNGKERTQEIVAAASNLTTDNCAANWCNAYGDAKGIPAGHWWLPSYGEAALVLRHRYAVQALYKLCGITLNLWSTYQTSNHNGNVFADINDAGQSQLWHGKQQTGAWYHFPVTDFSYNGTTVNANDYK